jgi:uncharacterized SAM-binding protein YcdF (DUF218 family)
VRPYRAAGCLLPGGIVPKVKRSGLRRTIRRGVGASVVIAALGGVAFVALYAAVRRGEWETVRMPADAVVVLGAQVHRGGRPSAALRGRVQRAAALYRQGYAPRIVVTGGVGDAGIAEAAVMQGIAVGLGVPETAIVLEPTATRTAESARAVGAICREAGWRSVIVVSDPFHLRRSALLFAAEGVRVQTAATDDAYFSARSRRYYRLREVAGLVVQTLFREIPVGVWWQGARRRL